MRSAPETVSVIPSGVLLTETSFTQLRPIAFGRKGERVAKTPTRLFPPRRGGRTVGDQVSRCALSKLQISHRCENSSMPRRASGTRYASSKTISERTSSARPLWRGTPNFSS